MWVCYHPTFFLAFHANQHIRQNKSQYFSSSDISVYRVLITKSNELHERNTLRRLGYWPQTLFVLYHPPAFLGAYTRKMVNFCNCFKTENLPCHLTEAREKEYYITIILHSMVIQHKNSLVSTFHWDYSTSAIEYVFAENIKSPTSKFYKPRTEIWRIALIMSELTMIITYCS